MSGRPWPEWRRKGHGSEAAIRRHYRRGEFPLAKHCPTCSEAEPIHKWARRHGPNVIPLGAGVAVKRRQRQAAEGT